MKVIKILSKKDLTNFISPLTIYKIDADNYIEKISYALRYNNDIDKKFNIADILYSRYFWLCKYNELFHRKYQHYDYEIQEEISHVIDMIDQEHILDINLLETLEKESIYECKL